MPTPAPQFEHASNIGEQNQKAQNVPAAGTDLGCPLLITSEPAVASRFVISANGASLIFEFERSPGRGLMEAFDSCLGAMRCVLAEPLPD